MNLIKSAKGMNSTIALKHRSMLTHTYLAVGHGGKVKFTNFNDWMWDAKMELTDTHWSEIKTSETYAMPMVPDRYNYACNFYHSYGSYWLVGNGLLRSDVNDTTACFTYPELHKVRDATVTKKLTNII
jgi:hypothetical protein